jgi:hypothetical protein
VPATPRKARRRTCWPTWRDWALRPPGFSAEFAALETDVVQHAQHEESEEFPLIVETRSEQQRAWMGMAVRAVQTLAPTHPHVTAAGSTIAQYVLGPIASLLDHGRDAAKKVLAG